MPGPGEGEENALGDVLGPQRIDAAIDGRGFLLVALEADERKLRLGQPGIDRGDPDRPAEQVLAEGVRETALRELRGDVRRSALVGLAACDRAHVDDVAP